MSLGGGFRMLYQPFRPFIAGTKVTKYMMMKKQEQETQTPRPNYIRTMIKDDLAMSPPATPVDLCAQARLTLSPSDFLGKYPIGSEADDLPGAEKVPDLPSPKITYDGFTFTADISDLLEVPSSPPESEVDSGEISPLHISEEETEVPLSQNGYISAELAEAAIKVVQSEPELGPVVTSVLKTGSVTPLVKEELRCTIQTKRLAKGKGELALTPEEEAESDAELTPEEEEKRRKRRERNKIAAQKCRNKKAVLAQQLTEETEMLEKKNEELAEEVASLKDEILSLRNMMLRHDKSIQCGNSFFANMSSISTVQPKSSPGKSALARSLKSKSSSQRPAKRQKVA